MISRYSKIPQLVQSNTDLGLGEVQKALQLKNANIQQNYISIKSNLDSLSKLDVIRGIDKDYVNEQLNSAVNELNFLGEVDLSDIRNASSANNIAGKLLNDKTIQNALLSTQNIRNVQKQREQINTNPKLSAYKSVVNESEENDQINEYLKSSSPGELFSLRNAITGMDTDKVFSEAAKNLKATISEEHPENDPLTKLTIKRKASADIASEIGKTIETNPEVQAQEYRNFKYLFKNPANYINAVNAGKRQTLDTYDKNIAQYDTLRAAAKQQNKPELVKAYDERIAEMKLRKESLDTGYLDSNDPDVTKKAWNYYINSKAQAYGERFKELEVKSSLDASSAFKMKNALDVGKFQYQQEKDKLNNSFQQQKIDLDTAKALGEINPELAANYLGGKGYPEFSQQETNPYTTTPVTLPVDFDANKYHNDTLGSLKDQNIADASEIVFRTLNQGGESANKINDLIAKGQIKSLQKNGKTIRGKYLLSPTGLNILNTWVDTMANTQGQVYSQQNTEIKQRLDRINENNFRYNFLKTNRDNILKRNNITEQDLKVKPTPDFPQDALSSFSSPNAGSPQIVTNQKVNNELRDFYQSELSYSRVPIAMSNENNDSKRKLSASQMNQVINQRQQVLNELRDTGIYSPSKTSRIYSIDQTQNGLKIKSDNVSDSLLEVDWVNSFENVIPNTNEVTFNLVNKKGEKIITDEFPDGLAVAKVKDETVTTLLKMVDPKMSREKFMAEKPVYDIVKRSDDRSTNKYLEGKLFPFKGLRTDINVGFNFSKDGERFIVKVPRLDRNFIVNSVDDFDKQFSSLFQQSLQEFSTNPIYAELDTEQKRVDAALKAVKTRLQ